MVLSDRSFEKRLDESHSGHEITNVCGMNPRQFELYSLSICERWDDKLVSCPVRVAGCRAWTIEGAYQFFKKDIRYDILGNDESIPSSDVYISEPVRTNNSDVITCVASVRSNKSGNLVEEYIICESRIAEAIIG